MEHLWERHRLASDELALAQNRYESARLALIDGVCCAALTDRGLLDWVYWNTDFPVPEIAARVGLTQHELRQRVLPVEAAKCDCGEPIYAKSRSSRQRLNSTNRWVSRLCEVCDLMIRAERDSRWEQERIARRARVEELRTMPYREYLQTPEWQEMRVRALKRAKFHCQVCYQRDTVLDVHHRTYERRGHEDISDLTVLCRRCHASHHQKESV